MRAVRIVRAAVVGAAVAGLGAALLGFLLRDRVALLAGLSYAPLLPAGIAAACVDAILKGRALPRRFSLAGAGLLLAALALVDAIGTDDPPPAAEPTITVLHQNLLWGGERQAKRASWMAMVETLRGKDADVLVLSECPSRAAMDYLLEELGLESMAFVEHLSPEYWYRMAVVSRWPTQLVAQYEIPDGVVLAVRVDAPDGALHVFVVDGQSDPLRDRRLMVADLRALIDAADPPVDIVAGDFNAPSRSVGFDALRRDFWLAAATSGEYAMTWPSPVPVLDLDQIWITTRRGGGDATLYFLPHSDHRGQTVAVGSVPVD